MAEFKGIVQYHDGLAVSDYVNMLPMGDTCLDRVGDELIETSVDIGSSSGVRGTFIDSANNVYIANGPSLFRAKYEPTTDTIGEFSPMEWIILGEKKVFQFQNPEVPVTFCESSIKPSVVFACDGRYIYMWNTTENKSGREERDPLLVNMMYLPNMNSDTVDVTTVTQPSYQDYVAGGDGRGYFENWEDDGDNECYISSICWFDNKLVGCNRSKNTVWITRTDPMSYFRNSPTGAEEEYSFPLKPVDGIDLWYNWYSSTNNADNLRDVASYGGQLYFFNDHSIEVWGRTGNEDSPIQPNTTQVIHFGGRCPLISEGVLYFIANDSMNSEFIAAFTPQFQKLSNPEIERRLDKPVDLQIIMQRKKNYLFVRFENYNGFLFKDGMWSSWSNPFGVTYKIRNSIVSKFAVVSDGRITKFNDRLRTSDGKRYNRYIRDGFTMLPKRAIFRRVYVVMDTGKTDRDTYPEPMDDLEIYVSISVDRGQSFQQRRYRKLGISGHNNKEIEWRNLGSGNSILVEFGTSSLHRLQLYDMGIDLQ